MPTGIYIHTGHPISEETKKKIGDANRIALKGKHCSPRTEFKKGIIPWSKGKHIYLGGGFKKGHPFGKRFKKGHVVWNKGIKGRQSWHNISGFKPGWNKGKQFSQETCLRMSKAMKGRKVWITGKHWSEEMKAKMSKSALGKHIGEANGNWQGGLTKKIYRNFGKALKEAIRNRDGRKCQLCGVPEQECLTKLDIHHIDYNKQNGSSDNLISLCHKCHTTTNFNKNREIWKAKFQGLLI